MAYTDLTAGQTDSKSPLDQQMQDLIRTNFTDLDSRVITLEGEATNWTSQLGTLITDTDMGDFDNDKFDNSDVKTILQVFEDTLFSFDRVQDTDLSEGNGTKTLITTATIKTSGRPVAIYWSSQIGCRAGGTSKANVELRIDASVTLNSHEAWYLPNVTDTVMADSATILDAIEDALEHAKTGQAVIYGAGGAAGADNVTPVCRHGYFTDYYPIAAGVHTFKLYGWGSNGVNSTFPARFRYSIIKVWEL